MGAIFYPVTNPKSDFIDTPYLKNKNCYHITILQNLPDGLSKSLNFNDGGGEGVTDQERPLQTRYPAEEHGVVDYVFD